MQQSFVNRIRDLAALATSSKHRDQFSREYAVVFSEVKAATEMMQELAQIQVAWLQEQFGQQARMN